MSFLDLLERRFGRFAIPGLIRIVAGFNALVFLLARLNPEFVQMLDLNRSAILRGEVWRLVTYIFIPTTDSPIWILFVLLFLWFIGEGLERAWGAFRVNLFYFLGMIGTTVAAFFFGGNFANTMLNASLFFAFASFYPDEVIYIFFVLPAKVKWIAWATAALLLFGFVTSPMSYRMAMIASLANYFIFFGPGLVRAARNRHQTANRRRRFEETARPEDEALHRCATCGATELTNPNLEFRVSRDGEEYCLAHLPSAVVAGGVDPG
ncbi:MAG: rhomboid family intramembrane serine protease [Verrucomicrobiota bacterium]|nr:rhomboid family intramembrane serine protease [Verrucomicrobiota bacterium]